MAPYDEYEYDGDDGYDPDLDEVGTDEFDDWDDELDGLHSADIL